MFFIIWKSSRNESKYYAKLMNLVCCRVCPPVMNFLSLIWCCDWTLRIFKWQWSCLLSSKYHHDIAVRLLCETYDDKLDDLLQSVPSSILDSHELTSITLQYRRECLASDVVQSLATCPECDGNNNNSIHMCLSGDEWKYSCAERAVAAAFGSGNPTWFGHKNHLHFSHLLRTQRDGAEIVRAKTTWRLKKRQAGPLQYGDRPPGL